MVWLVLFIIAVIILVCVKSKYSNNATEKVTDDKSDIIQLYTKTDGFYTYPDIDKIKSFYNLENLEKYENGFIKLAGDNRTIATNDVLCLNEQLAEAHNRYRKFPLVKMTPDPFYDELIVDGQCGYRTLLLEFSDKTKSGKIPKHPVKLLFHYSNSLHGEINYNQKGEISRSRIIAWQNGICYIIISELLKDDFSIKFIYDNNNGQKLKLYERGISI